jgi:uroporphyrinogen decarboxylase
MEKLFLRAIAGEQVERPPVWMMRQAGRYLPEYHAEKAKAGGFLGLCRIPEHGIEVTLQPIRRFGFDAAILFSDILTPLPAMGIELDFTPGPTIGNPIKTRADVDALRIPDIETALPFVLEIITGLRQSLPGETALIGFAGAPFTVASYMVSERHGKGAFEQIRTMLYASFETVFALVSKLEEMTYRYLSAQIEAGAEAVQLFDSSAWQLPGHLIGPLAFEPAKRIISKLKKTKVPTIYFAPGAMAMLDPMRAIGADVLGVDWRIDLQTARQIVGIDQAVQGNLDPAVLLSTPDAVRNETRRIIHENKGRPGHLFNLGHGVLPETPIENVERLVQTVKESETE